MWFGNYLMKYYLTDFLNNYSALSILYWSVIPIFWFSNILILSPNIFYDIYDFPQNIITGFLYFLLISIIPFITLPLILCSSTFPYPVIIISVFFISYYRFVILLIVYIPLTIYALKNARHPAPNPPAAPPPGI